MLNPLHARKNCLELKSLKEYSQCYRNLGIFQENIVNQVLGDVVQWAKTVWAEVRGEFSATWGDIDGDCGAMAKAYEIDSSQRATVYKRASYLLCTVCH